MHRLTTFLVWIVIGAVAYFGVDIYKQKVAQQREPMEKKVEKYTQDWKDAMSRPLALLPPKIEDVLKRTVETVSPEVRPCGCVNELSSNTHSVCRFANTPFQHIAHPKFAPDLLDIDCFALVGKARIAGDDEQRSETRQRRDDVLDHSISKVILFRITAHVLERKHGDGRLVRKREHLALAHSRT